MPLPRGRSKGIRADEIPDYEVGIGGGIGDPSEANAVVLVARDNISLTGRRSADEGSVRVLEPDSVLEVRDRNRAGRVGADEVAQDVRVSGNHRRELRQEIPSCRLPEMRFRAAGVAPPI